MRIFSIVLADDEQKILYGMRNGIEWEELGFTVVGTAQNGKEALELIEEYHPDLLISDIKMPFMDGMELSKTIHENYMNTKIILFSGWDDFEYARMAISYGVSEYIMKPINYDEMKRLLLHMYAEFEKEYDEKINRQRLENVYKASLSLFRQRFFSQLVTGTIRPEMIEQNVQNLDLNFSSIFYLVAVKIRNDNSDDVLSELSIKETIREALEKVSVVHEFSMYDKELYLLCTNKLHNIEKITKTLEETSVLIEKIFSSSISCGIGSHCREFEDIPNMYTQTIEALEYNLVIKGECYTYYNDILPLAKKVNDWSGEVGAIEHIITSCTEEELWLEVERILEKIHQAHYNLNEYQVVILEIVFAIARLYKKYQITTDEEFSGSKKMAVKILSLDTGEELDNWLANYCMLIRSLIQKKQIDNNTILVDKAKTYVQEYFADPGLSVEVICSELHVSSSHFSKIFKQETGMTFLNYLIGIRMDAAKRLLEKTDYKSHVIGEMVGYLEPNYFSYVFKKNCGVSPAKYRKSGE
ncbi:response regulator transcription factor [Anaerosacchariphilus polymeriproducens]|uniref:Stage 0 sporulation protein A homolog n=1 Tax=Anaerosacchariphilus polymeriproducens TaxID=1812858 RepID=A0A371AVU5_9FIRM|nr:response regulator [Anaerosacchariphilus polymeriproducens]RDU23696.1 response regulator [Anaerosacchariphilus polymeriproducens]